MLSYIDIIKFQKKGFSQGGEEGILDFLITTIGVQKKWFVELGASNGITGSNTRFLMLQNWNGICIEGNSKRFLSLKNNTKDFSNIFCCNKMVSLEYGYTINEILNDFPCPKDFDLLSIDIDGNDYWVWKSLTEYNPSLVVIEYNPNWSESLSIRYDKNHRYDRTKYFGATATALESLGKTKGYTLVCLINGNLFFVRNDFAKDIFEPIDLSKVSYIMDSHRPTNRKLIHV